MRKFNVGDRVRVVAKCRNYGEVTTVVAADVASCPNCGLPLHEFTDKPVYVLDLPARAPMHRGDGCLALCEVDDIVPVYDGDEPAKWADCVWQPNKITVC